MKPVAAAFLIAGVFWLSAHALQPEPVLHAARNAASDLEVNAAGKTEFVAYQDLLRLPQVDFKASHDSNVPTGALLGGVALDQLRRSLAANADGVLAICKDGYRSNYPMAYLSAHHPVLVLTVDGKPPAEWPKSSGGAVLGPYIIANPDFVPSFKVLSHDDEAQIPFQVVRLEFRLERDVLAPIMPKGEFPAGSPVMQGYQIAQQNCFRCHNMGAEGGQMASIPWPVIAAVAKADPAFFARYVRTPQVVNPHSRMAGSPDYDDETIAALRAYFIPFAAGEK